jgi:hypothetical protein
MQGSARGDAPCTCIAIRLKEPEYYWAVKVMRSTSVAVRAVPGTIPVTLVINTFLPTTRGDDPIPKIATICPETVPGAKNDVTLVPLSVALNVDGSTVSPSIPN